MSDKNTVIPESSLLFKRTPIVGQMRDPLRTEWNLALDQQLDQGQYSSTIQSADDINLAELIDLSQMNAIFQNFLEVVGLPVAVVNFEGHVLVSSKWQRLCTEFHRVNSETLQRCLESDTSLSRQMQEGKPYAIYRCRNGLTDCASPIIIDGQHIANLFIGQFFLEPPNLDYFEAQCLEFGFERDAYFQALAEVPIISEKKIPAILNLLAGLAQQLASKGLAEYRAKQAYASVEQRIIERTRELQASHTLLEKLSSQVPGVIYQFLLRPDGSSCLPYASEGINEIFELTPDAVHDSAAAIFERLHPDDYDHVHQVIQESARNLTPWYDDFRVILPRQGLLWREGNAIPERLSDGSVLWHGFITDITERKRAEEKLRVSEERHRLLADNAIDIIWTIGIDGALTYVSPSVEKLRGYSPTEVMRQSLEEMLTPDSLAIVLEYRGRLRANLQAGIPVDNFRGELQHWRKDGSIIWVEVIVSPILDSAGNLVELLGVSRDISERKQMEEQINQLAFYDPLTKLPNRRLLLDRLTQTMSASKRSGCYGAVMFLDLDNFKPLNDTYGHAVGDLLLIEAAHRLKSCIRDMDTVARFGGDEFVVLLSELNQNKIESNRQAFIVAEKICNILSEPYRLRLTQDEKDSSTVEHHCTASIGVTVFINHETNQDEILEFADAAMYQAKEAGRNRIRFYE